LQKLYHHSRREAFGILIYIGLGRLCDRVRLVRLETMTQLVE